MAIAERVRKQSNAVSGIIGDDLISDQLETVRLPIDEPVYTQDDYLNSFYLVRSGLLGLYRMIYPDKQILVNKISKGEPVGVTQILKHTQFPGRVVPIKETIAYKGTADDLAQLRTHKSGCVTDMLMHESESHFGAIQKIDDLIGKELSQRIAGELIDLANRIGQKTEDGYKIIVKLTRKQISRMIGCTQESVIRILSDWEQRNIIKTEHKYITLLKPETLHTITSNT